MRVEKKKQKNWCWKSSETHAGRLHDEKHGASLCLWLCDQRRRFSAPPSWFTYRSVLFRADLEGAPSFPTAESGTGRSAMTRSLEFFRWVIRSFTYTVNVAAFVVFFCFSFLLEAAPTAKPLVIYLRDRIRRARVYMWAPVGAFPCWRCTCRDSGCHHVDFHRR